MVAPRHLLLSECITQSVSDSDCYQSQVMFQKSIIILAIACLVGCHSLHTEHLGDCASSIWSIGMFDFKIIQTQA